MDRWVTRDLARYSVETCFEDYPAEIVSAAKTFILDNIGCMLGGCRSALGKAMLDPVRQMGGSPEATLIGTRVKVPTIQAALVNGTTANALDFDDALGALGHPGATIIPAALAMGEWKHASGKELINAVLIGYDVGNRIARAIQATNERLEKVQGMGTWPTFGAVAAAGKILKFDLDLMLNAFGVAGATAPLPNTQKWGWDIEERPIHWVKEPTGWPAWTGTLAAILAANGFLGNRYILDGDNGFWIMSGSDRCQWDLMTEGLGEQFDILNVSIKPYSACRWQHAALDCITLLKSSHKFTAEQIKEVIFHSFKWVKRHEVYGPKEMVDAAFCIPHTASMLLLDYPCGPEWYADETLADDNIKEYSRRIRVEVDPEIDRIYWEEGKVSTRVEILLVDGQRLTAFVDIPSGDPLNPLGREQIEDKFRTLASYSLKNEDAETVLDMLNDLENVDEVNTFMKYL